LDDNKIKNFTSCFKEKKFLVFFFDRLKLNKTGRYEQDFPFFSPCGREKNYVRCDDFPIVFTHSFYESNQWFLSYGYADNKLKVPFYPTEICMLPETGRVYHPAVERAGGIGLIKSAFAIELSKNFIFSDNQDSSPPCHFVWQDKIYDLSNRLLPLIKERSSFT